MIEVLAVENFDGSQQSLHKALRRIEDAICQDTDIIDSPGQAQLIVEELADGNVRYGIRFQEE